MVGADADQCDARVQGGRSGSSARPALLRTGCNATGDAAHHPPKHKGSEHLQAELKTKVKELTEALAGARKGGARTGPPPCCGGGRRPGRAPGPSQQREVVAPRPPHRFARRGRPVPLHDAVPQPGMMPFEDINFQLVDLRRSRLSTFLRAARHAPAGRRRAPGRRFRRPGLRRAGRGTAPTAGTGRVTLTGSWEPHSPGEADDLFAIVLPTLLMATKTHQCRTRARSWRRSGNSRATRTRRCRCRPSTARASTASDRSCSSTSVWCGCTRRSPASHPT